MATLQDIINRLPKVLGRRYSEPFWVNAANKVLLDIEQRRELPRVKEEFGLILKEKITNYKIPDYVKKVLGLYLIGHPNTNYRLDEEDWTIRGQVIEIPDGFNVKNETLHENLVIAVSGDMTIVVTGQITGVDNYLVSVKTATDTELIGKTSMIQTSSYDDINDQTTLYLKRPLISEIQVGDTIDINQYFLNIEYVKGFTRVKDLVCDIINDEDVQRVLEEGMRYFGEIQTDEESQFAMRWERQYEKAIKQYLNRRTRGVFKQKPKFDVDLQSLRGEPGRLYGNNSGVFGDPEQQG
jgi:hypothetical protein